MAFISVGWIVTVNFKDRGGNTTEREYPLTTAASDDEASRAASLTAILNAVAGVSDAGVTGYSMRQKFEDDAFALPTLATAEVSAHAEVTGRLDGFATKTATVDIPAPKDALFVASTGPNYNVVNPTNAEVLAYAGLFGVAAGIATISDGEQFSVTANFVGKRTHSKSRKG